VDTNRHHQHAAVRSARTLTFNQPSSLAAYGNGVALTSGQQNTKAGSAKPTDARKKVWQFVIFAASKINGLVRSDVERFGSKRLKSSDLRLI